MKQYMIDYNQKVTQIKEGIKVAATRAKQTLSLRQFCIVTASFRRLLPSLLEKYSYEVAFTELMWKRRLATLDELSTERVFDIQFTGEYQSVIKDRQSPRIFCAYHLGSYRAIIGALAKLGYDFTLIVSSDVYKNQKDRIIQTVLNINQRCHTTSNFEILNAEIYDTAMKIVKHLKKGRSIIAYADGNTGVGGSFRQDEKLLKLTFLGQAIFARQGIAYASFLANVPVIPVISYRKEETDIILEFFKPISPAKITSRKQYCQSVIGQLFQYLEAKIKQYPLQWEGWLYVHKYLDLLSSKEEKNNKNEFMNASYLSSKIENNLIQFNHDRFSLFVIEDTGFLFDRNQYKAFPLEKNIFHFLKRYWSETVCDYYDHSINIEDRQWLYLLKQNILQII